RTSSSPPDPGMNSVDVWHFEKSLNPPHYVPQLIDSASLTQWIFSNVSGNNEGGSDDPVVTGLGKVAFKALMIGSNQTYLRTNATKDGTLSEPGILIHRGDHSLFPMIADDGRVVIKAGSEPISSFLGFQNSIRLYDLRVGFNL